MVHANKGAGVCKAAGETGGPRRCAGDSRDRLQRSSAAVDDLEYHLSSLVAAVHANPGSSMPGDGTGCEGPHAPPTGTGNTDGVDWTQLATVPLSYAEAGATAGPLPVGYHHIRREHAIGAGRAAFDEAATKLMSWELQRSAGVLVDASEPTAHPGAMVTVGVGPLNGACRVVYVVNEPNRRGFAYGTLHGHPESGEEFFGVRFDPTSNTVYTQVIAFSRPGRWWSKAGSWLGSIVQQRITNRYLSALSREGSG